MFLVIFAFVAYPFLAKRRTSPMFDSHGANTGLVLLVIVIRCRAIT